MNLLVLYLGTVGFSFCLEKVKEFRLYKDIADAGYKFDRNRLLPIIKIINLDFKENTVLSYFIPVYNVINALTIDFSCDGFIYMLFESLNKTGVLKKMNRIETKEYQKKPTGLNALLLPIKMKWKLKNASKIILLDGSVVYFEIEDNEMLIYKAYGSISKLPEEKQAQVVLEEMTNYITTTKFKGEKIDYFIVTPTIKESFAQNLAGISLDKSEKTVNQDNSREARINELEQLKEELLQEQDEVVDKPYGRGRRR